MGLFGNPKCPHCGNELEETGYSSFYPQYRCKFCIEKNKEKEKILKKIEKLEQEVKELKKK